MYTEGRIQKLQTCVQEVMAFLFPLVDEETPTKHAHHLASLIYSGELFGKEAAIDSAFTMARQVTRAIYTGRILLKKIDLRSQGSMNDSSITELHQLESEAGISKQKRGDCLISSRHQISEYRATTNRLAKKVLEVRVNEDAEKCKYGEFVAIDDYSMIVLALHAYGLYDIAVKAYKNPAVDDVRASHNGDGAEVVGKGSKSQCAT